MSSNWSGPNDDYSIVIGDVKDKSSGGFEFNDPDGNRGVFIGDVKDKSDDGFNFDSNGDGDERKARVSNELGDKG